MKQSSLINNGKAIETYCIIASIFAFITVLLVAYSRGALIECFFFNNAKDCYMDFFNSIIDARDGAVYERGVIYPPIVNIGFYLISLFIPPQFVGLPFQNRWEIKGSREATTVFLISIIVSILFFLYCLKKFCNFAESKNFKYFAILIILSYPLLFGIDRGNVILISVSFLLLFLTYKDSDNKLLSEFALVCLALSAAIKIYPAIFGLILITEKKYAKALRAVLYGVGALLIPFVFYGGLDGIRLWIENVLNFAESGNPVVAHFAYDIKNASIKNLLSLIYLLTGAEIEFLKTPLFFVSEVITLFSFFVLPKRWQKYAALTYMMTNIISCGGIYSMVFWLIPLCELINEKKIGKIELICEILFFSKFFCIPPLAYLFSGTIEPFLASHGITTFDVVYNLNGLISMPVEQATLFFLVVMSIGVLAKKVKRPAVGLKN